MRASPVFRTSFDAIGAMAIKINFHDKKRAIDPSGCDGMQSCCRHVRLIHPFISQFDITSNGSRTEMITTSNANGPTIEQTVANTSADKQTISTNRYLDETGMRGSPDSAINLASRRPDQASAPVLTDRARVIISASIIRSHVTAPPAPPHAPFPCLRPARGEADAADHGGVEQFRDTAVEAKPFCGAQPPPLNAPTRLCSPGSRPLIFSCDRRTIVV